MATVQILDGSLTTPASQPKVQIMGASFTAPSPAGAAPAKVQILKAKLTVPGGGAVIRVTEASFSTPGAPPGGSKSGRFVLKNNVWTEFKSYTLKNGTWQ